MEPWCVGSSCSYTFCFCISSLWFWYLQSFFSDLSLHFFLFFFSFQHPKTMKNEYLENGCAPGSVRGPYDAGSTRLTGTSLWPPILDNQPIVHTAETLYGKKRNDMVQFPVVLRDSLSVALIYCQLLWMFLFGFFWKGFEQCLLVIIIFCKHAWWILNSSPSLAMMQMKFCFKVLVIPD